MKNIFLPHKNNDFHPHIFRPLYVGLVLLAFILAKILFFIFSPAQPILASDLTIENILVGINNERSLRNLTTLKTDSRLSTAAQGKTDDMQARHYFSHTDPDGHYIWDKIVAQGYTPYSSLGENLAIEFYNTESLVAAWMNSPTHRANVLNESFRDQGMGITFGDSDKGQYHSAIANTFGALLVSKNQSTPSSKPTPTPAPTNKILPTPTKAPAPTAVKQTLPKTTPTPVVTPSISAKNPINPRQGSGAAALPTKGTSTELALGSQSTNQDATKTEEAPLGDSGVVGKWTDLYQKNRALNLVLGLLLLLFLIIDLKFFQKQNYPGLDKKINNLTLLFLAVLLTAFLYWL